MALGKSANKLLKDPGKVVFTQEKPRMFLREEVMKGLNNAIVTFIFVSVGLGGKCKSSSFSAETPGFGQSDDHSLAQIGTEVSDIHLSLPFSC